MPDPSRAAAPNPSMTPPKRPAASMRDRVVTSALWLIATRWLHRLIGLASTMVLARVLMPQDFGVVAAVTAVVAVIDGFFEFGFDLSLIRAQEFRREDYDTTWTLRIAKGVVFGLLVIAVSPLVSMYAQTPDVVAISVVLGVGLMIRGCENIGIVRFEKELQYDRLFRIRLYPRLAGTITTIALALTLRSYWAIVFGSLMQNAYQVLFSFLQCEFRPRLRVQGSRAIWHFSKWILISGISRKTFDAADRLMVSGLTGKRELGFFTVTASLASLITNELVGAVGNALIPGYAKLQDETARLRAAFLMSQSAFVALLLPTSIGVWLLAPSLTEVVLGAQWTDAAPMLGAFAVFYMCFSIAENLNRFMAMTGLQVATARSGLIRTVVFLALVYPSFRLGGLTMIIATKIVISAIEIVYLSSLCCRRVETRLARYLSHYVRPAIACVAMALAISGVGRIVPAPPLLTLFVGALAGALVYLGTLLLSWRLSGRPPGLETLVIDLLAGKGLWRRP
jgi:lipopolysaccharide exporter